MPTHDIDARRIGWVGGALALVVVLVVAAVFLLLKGWHVSPRAEHAPLTVEALPPGAPPLQSAPQTDLAGYRAHKQRVLQSGAWLDAQHGTARIPIATAMDLLARSPGAAAGEPGGAQ